MVPNLCQLAWYDSQPSTATMVEKAQRQKRHSNKSRERDVEDKLLFQSFMQRSDCTTQGQESVYQICFVRTRENQLNTFRKECWDRIVASVKFCEFLKLWHRKQWWQKGFKWPHYSVSNIGQQSLQVGSNKIKWSDELSAKVLFCCWKNNFTVFLFFVFLPLSRKVELNYWLIAFHKRLYGIYPVKLATIALAFQFKFYQLFIYLN